MTHEKVLIVHENVLIVHENVLKVHKKTNVKPNIFLMKSAGKVTFLM